MKWLVVCVILLATGCATESPLSSATPTPTSTPSAVPAWVVELGDARAITVDLTIRDETGHLVDAVSLDELSDTPTPMAVVEAGKVIVSWNSGACNDPVLRLTGTADDLRVSLWPNLSPEPDPGFECPAALLFLGVVLTFSEPIDQDAITFVTL
jgi:hypothetical protein